jgi:hypothetical protein
MRRVNPMSEEERRQALHRMESVLKHRGWKSRDWARAAGMPEETHLALIMRGLRLGPKSSRGQIETWYSLSRSAGVSLEWLAFGAGAPPWWFNG